MNPADQIAIQAARTYGKTTQQIVEAYWRARAEGKNTYIATGVGAYDVLFVSIKDPTSMNSVNNLIYKADSGQPIVDSEDLRTVAAELKETQELRAKVAKLEQEVKDITRAKNDWMQLARSNKASE